MSVALDTDYYKARRSLRALINHAQTLPSHWLSVSSRKRISSRSPPLTVSLPTTWPRRDTQACCAPATFGQWFKTTTDRLWYAGVRFIIVLSRAEIAIRKACKNKGGFCLYARPPARARVCMCVWYSYSLMSSLGCPFSIWAFLTPVTLLVFAGTLPAVKARDYAARPKGSAYLCESHR